VNYATEITYIGRLVWLDTSETSHKAARAFDAVVWRVGHLRRDMNFYTY
jgi:hypothetical protein